MLQLLANSVFASRLIRRLRPLRAMLRQSSTTFGRIEATIIRIVAARLEAGFKESLIDSGRLRMTQLKLVNWRLWSGHSVYALQILERVIAAKACERSVRAEAAMFLAAWYAADAKSERSLQMQEAAVALHPEVRKTNTYILLKINNLLDCERHSQLRRYADEVRFEEKIDCHVEWSLINALEGGGNVHSRLWLNAVNQHFRSEGLCEIGSKQGGVALSITNLTGLKNTGNLERRHVAEKREPLISVIVPAYNAAGRIAVALESLLNQTWSNIEVLVVDDCSTDHTKEVVLEFAARDERIKYLAMPENKGSYSARNHGLDYAKGEFVTTHDIDDWSHPDKLKEQATQLMDAANLKGNVSVAIRCTENLRFLGNWRPNGMLIKDNLSSFMFRKSILDRVGKWDSVRIGGDSEFVNRVKLFFGNNSVSVVHPDLPLSFVLGDHESLTSAGSTHIRSFYFGVRREYAAMTSFWHSILRQSGAAGNRPHVSVPPMIRPERRCDISVNAAVLLDAANDQSSIRLVKRLVETSRVERRVGIFHWPGFGEPRETDIEPGLRRLAFDGQLVVLIPGQTVFADKVVIGSSGVWRSTPDHYPEIKVSTSDAIQSRDGVRCEPELMGLPQGMITVKRRHTADREGQRT